jgi:diacylglycerol kinase (ATP)
MGGMPQLPATSTKKRVLLLVNPAARNGRSLIAGAHEITKHLEQRIEIVIPDSSSREAQIDSAKQAILDGVDAVLVRGGDGAVHGALNLLVDHPVPLGVIPAGSGNDFARALRLPRNRPAKVLKQLLQAFEIDPRTTPIDVIKTTVRSESGLQRTVLVANSVNIGFDAIVNQRGNELTRAPASLRYFIALLQVVRKFMPIPFQTHGRHTPSMKQKLALICVQNGPFIGGGIPLAPGALINDGRIECSTVRAVSRLKLVTLFPLLMLRAHRLLRPLRTTSITELTVEVPEGVPVYADGEELMSGENGACTVHMVVQPRTVELLLPYGMAAPSTARL